MAVGGDPSPQPPPSLSGSWSACLPTPRVWVATAIGCNTWRWLALGGDDEAGNGGAEAVSEIDREGGDAARECSSTVRRFFSSFWSAALCRENAGKTALLGNDFVSLRLQVLDVDPLVLRLRISAWDLVGPDEHAIGPLHVAWNGIVVLHGLWNIGLQDGLGMDANRHGHGRGE
ncbi:hypothetical protein Droror1_Dr00015629 [Drosera rotundifolia]